MSCAPSLLNSQGRLKVTTAGLLFEGPPAAPVRPFADEGSIGATTTFTRRASACARDLGAPSLITIVVNSAHSSDMTLEDTGVRAYESSTMRLRFFFANREVRAFGKRTVRAGSSARIVLMPTRMASAPCLNFIPKERAAAPVIHLDSAEAVAIFPSRVIAALTVTKGVR